MTDALGGLDRAINYAKCTYTNNDNVTVEHWPKNSFSIESLPDLLMSLKSSDLSSAYESFLCNETIDSLSIDTILANIARPKFADKPHFMLAMDEKTALELIVKGE